MNTNNFTENRFLKLIDNIDQRGTSQSNGVPFSPFRPFEDLSMKERAAVIRIGVQNGLRDLESIRSKYNEYADGGSIHIKPENRGKFTALKERTGHSASWFKEHGTPAQKKMAIFALNARKWKHEDGGHLYDGESEDSQQMYTGFDWWNRAPMTDYMDIAYEPIPDNAPKSKGTPLLDTPIMVQTTPTASTAATFGQYMPKYESTPKRELITLGATVAAPFIPSVGQFGLNAMNTAFTPSTWLNPVTGAKLLSPTVGTIADAGVQGAFAYEGLNGLWNQGRQGTLLSDPLNTFTHSLEILPVASPLIKAGTKGVNAATNGIKTAIKPYRLSLALNNMVARNIPMKFPSMHGIDVYDLTGGIKNTEYTGSPMFEFAQTLKTSPNRSYFMVAPSKVDILKLRNGRFRHEVVGNNILPSGEVDGKFVSYGEPWREFALGENSALYEFPVGPRRGPSLMATDWKGRPQEYSVDEIYDYMLKENNLRAAFDKDVATMGLNKLKGTDRVKAYRVLKEEKYPELLQHYDTSIYGANQTVIPNSRWNFDKFLKTPFWKYSANPESGQVQKELFMRGNSIFDDVNASSSIGLFKKGAVTNMANPSFRSSSFDSNLFEKVLFENKLRGIEPIKGVGYPGDAYSITEGVSPAVKERLMKNVVGRNVRELESEGFRPNAIRNYTKNLSDALDEVRVGRFSDRDFVKAGMGDDAGFYIDGDNFIAINRDATAFTDEYIQGHEGRHLMDYRQSLTNNQENILSNAYGDDFVNIPNTKYAEGLDNYANMVKEKVTTNHDARATLLGNKQDIFDIHAQDLVIDKTPDTKIFDAVEKANGYGRRYIKYLRENNLLTPEKAQAFREAMKHVGGYVPWTIGGGSLGYGYLNQDEGPLVEMAMGGKLKHKNKKNKAH